VIRGNSCSTNGLNAGDGAGINATGADNRIEGNHCTGADRGIEAAAAGNIIIRNTCSGNTTDWVIAASNVFGPIIDRRTPGSAAVSGFSAAGSMGSTDPNANFSY
jgi:parallel beta-helix repeat protein